MITIRCISTFK